MPLSPTPPPSGCPSPMSGAATPPISRRRRAGLDIKIEEAKKVIRSALDEHGIDRISLSFNGGKDCTLLLHLLYTILNSPPYSCAGPAHPSLKAIYITAPSPFAEVEAFVDEAAQAYNLDLVRIGGGMKSALAVYLDEDESASAEERRAGRGKGKGVQGVLVGTRRNDPHGASLSLVQPTDPSWPSFLRIHPILNWTYTDVWDYLREFQVSWCSLYDEGYTSLGSSTNTHPNPALLTRPSSTIPPRSDVSTCLSNRAAMYQPAWMLENESLERAGRGDAPPPTTRPTLDDEVQPQAREATLSD